MFVVVISHPLSHYDIKTTYKMDCNQPRKGLHLPNNQTTKQRWRGASNDFCLFWARTCKK